MSTATENKIIDGDGHVVEDIATHPFWVRYRALALAQGLRACWSTPIFSPERELLVVRRCFPLLCVHDARGKRASPA